MKLWSCGCYNELSEGAKFIELLDLMLRLGADPNVVMEEFRIDHSLFSNVTPMHMSYLIWKLNKSDDKRINSFFEQIFDRMLENPRTDLKTTFSEEYNDRAPDWDSVRGSNCLFDRDFHESLRTLLEDANLLHYASSNGDIITANKLLDRDPDLLHTESQLLQARTFCIITIDLGMGMGIVVLYMDSMRMEN